MLQMVLLDTNKIPKKSVEQIKEKLSKFGELTCYNSTDVDELVSRCQNASIILVNKNQINEEHFKALPNLKYIIVVATGYDNVDVIAARQYNIKVSNIPTYGSQSVAQHAIALLLELTNQVGLVSSLVKDGKWSGTRHKHLELANLTLGIFGFGNIAQCTIKIALGFGMNVLVCSSHGGRASYVTDLPLKFVDRDVLFMKSDVISLHCPMSDDTKDLINTNSLSLMKPNCLLINTSRGGLVNEADLYHALKTKQIAGAGLDVFNPEPIDANNPLLTLDNCFVSPHNAWVSDAALARWLNSIEEYVVNFTENKFTNIV